MPKLTLLPVTTLRGFAVLLLCLGMTRVDARPETLPQPQGEVLLTVAGQITTTNVDRQAVFDRAMLEELGGTVIETSTAWTEGVSRFEGVLLQTLLETVGSRGAPALTAAAQTNTVKNRTT